MNTNIFALASGLSDHDLLARLRRSRRQGARGDRRARRPPGRARRAAFPLRRRRPRFPLQLLHAGAAALRGRRVQPHPRGSGVPALSGDPRPAGLRRAVADHGPYAARAPHAGEPRGRARRASGRSRREIDLLVAELAPRPDVPSSVRKLPTAAVVPLSRFRARARGKCAGDDRRDGRGLAGPARPITRRVRRRGGRSSSPRRQSGIASSSRSARTRTTSCGGFRTFSAARSRTAIRARSSIVRSPCSSRRSRGRSWERRRAAAVVLSVPGRIGGLVETLQSRNIPRAHPSAWPGGVTEVSARFVGSERSAVHRAHLPGVPPHRALRAGWAGHPRQHLVAVPPAQSIRGGARLRAARRFENRENGACRRLSDVTHPRPRSTGDDPCRHAWDRMLRRSPRTETRGRRRYSVRTESWNG